jgi:hypothetical protein
MVKNSIENRERHDAVKANCVKLLESMSNLHETPNHANKEIFVSQISKTRQAIISYLELIDIDANVGKNHRTALRILCIDLDPIKIYSGAFDSSHFKPYSSKALDAIIKINDIINENNACFEIFKENIQSVLDQFYAWFTRVLGIRGESKLKVLSKEIEKK